MSTETTEAAPAVLLITPEALEADRRAYRIADQEAIAELESDLVRVIAPWTVDVSQLLNEYEHAPWTIDMSKERIDHALWRGLAVRVPELGEHVLRIVKRDTEEG